MNKETLIKIIEGDQSAYSALYIEYFKKFYNYGKKFTPDVSLIEDVIQEVFLDFWAKKEKLLNVENYQTYFFSSFKYTLLKKIKQAYKTDYGNTNHSEPQGDFLIDQVMINKELSFKLQQKLQKALNALTAHQREAIFLRFYEKLSYEEVAAVLNITVKATYKIMARSLTVLRDSMQLSVTALMVLLRT
jgi:RNA polymerase sigma factor (sigma-70 family)